MDALAISYTNKTIRMCFDHRLALVKVLLHLGNRLPYQCYMILYTLAEIQYIAYGEESASTNQQILGHYNLIFLYFIYLKEVVSHTPKNYTPRKFYGKYFHDIIRLASVQQRLICGLSANSENGEQYFKTIESITNTTSNRKSNYS